ncbi:MAG TPA: FHA domain-containing protein [Casimicrobiaceae bacterium]|nr:FHA domain-containing protein [Casimicrobiaceae bacterium]
MFLPDGTTLDVPLVRERTAIGRRADNDICLPNLAVSGEHAVVVTILADSFLEDLGSTNGTLVNGNPIAKYFLRDRDQIDIGRHKLVYCADDEAVINSDAVAGMARINARDFGDRVEAAKPFVRAQRAKVPESPPAQQPAASDTAAVPVVPASLHKAAPPVSPVPSSPTASMSGWARIKVLSGVNAGVSVSLDKEEVTVGRPGVQVASIVKAGTSFRLKPVEGASPPTINGKPVGREGVDLAHGDAIEIAGTRLEFVDPRSGPAQQDVAA